MLLCQSRGRTAAPLAVTRVTTRVMPNDLDLNRHVNNGRVLTLADLLAAVGHAGLVSPELPAWMQTWSASLDQLSAAGRAAAPRPVAGSPLALAP